MKNLLTAVFCLLALSGCSKKAVAPDNKITVKVFDLSSNTAVSIRITDQNNKLLLNVVNKFDNTTYTTDPVYPGDRLEIHYSANIDDDGHGGGDGTIWITYKGIVRRSIGGAIGTKGGDIIYTIPTE